MSIAEAEVLRGVMPVSPTIFREDESLDLQSQSRVYDFLVSAGSSAICVLANYSEQFSLTDDERAELTQHAVRSVAGRVPVWVATSHFSARVARQRSLFAQEVGASGVMLMAPFFGATLSPSEELVFDYFVRVCDGLQLPVMIQDAPMSPTLLSVELIARLSEEIPNLRYAKIEVPRTADKIRALVRRAGATLPGLFDGEEGVTLIPDLDSGAVGAMTSSLLPDKIAEIVAAYSNGLTSQAEKAWERVLPLIQFENRQCGLAAAKAVLKAGGVIDCAAVRAPLADLDPWKITKLVELAKSLDLLAFRWDRKEG